MIERVDKNGNSNEAARIVSIAFEEPEIVLEAVKAAGGMVAASINGSTPERVRLRRTETGCFIDIEATVNSGGATMLLCFEAGQIAAGEMFYSISRKEYFSEGATGIADEAKSSLQPHREGILRLALDLLSAGEVGSTDADTVRLWDEGRDEEKESATAKRKAKK